MTLRDRLKQGVSTPHLVREAEEPTPAKPVLPAKVWEVDPVTRTITPREPERIEDLITEVVGPDAECFKLDNNDNVVWLSDIPTNKHHAFYFERMFGPFSARRYNTGLIISLGEIQWDLDDINYYLRFCEKK